MATDHEIALVRAVGPGEQEKEIFWIFSRAQIEFVLKELDHFSSSTGKVMARYQEMTLPVLSLEENYGILDSEGAASSKYLVIRSVDAEGKIRRMIVGSSASPQFSLLDTDFSPLPDFSLPANSGQILGAYSLGGDKVGVVPDVINICQALD